MCQTLDIQPGNYVEFEVTDSGVGMSADVLKRVFEPFFTTKMAGRGTGLGLSQIYGFVKQSGGFVRIASSPGKGTTVRVYLPGQERQTKPAIEEGKELEAPCAITRGRVLVVEDQADVRAQIVDALEELSLTVTQAADGRLGLEALETLEPFDLLITDVGLPGLNGRQLAEAARASQPHLPILLITGYAGKSLEKWKLGSNMQLLRKPFTLDEFTAKVQALFRSASSEPRPMASSRN